MRDLLGRFACSCALVVACGSPNGQPSTAEAQTARAPLRAEDAPARNLLNAYLAAQVKLAADDFKGAHAALERLRTALAAPGFTLSDELRRRVEASLNACSAAADLKAARTAFAPLSEALLSWLSAQSNPLGESVGVAHCPMALSGKGAKWLQLGDTVKNPYFGAEMLECGSIDARVAPGKKL